MPKIYMLNNTSYTVYASTLQCPQGLVNCYKSGGNMIHNGDGWNTYDPVNEGDPGFNSCNGGDEPAQDMGRYYGQNLSTGTVYTSTIESSVEEQASSMFAVLFNFKNYCNSKEPQVLPRAGFQYLLIQGETASGIFTSSVTATFLGPDDAWSVIGSPIPVIAVTGGNTSDPVPPTINPATGLPYDLYMYRLYSGDIYVTINPGLLTNPSPTFPVQG